MSQASQAIFEGISRLLTQHRAAEARAELERLLALDPDDPEARAQAADVYAYTGAHAEAYQHYHWAAETYNRLGRADMALAVHHKMLELDAASLDSAAQTRLRLLGILVAAEDAIVAGDHERAVACYREAIRVFPNHTISYQRLASLLVRMNRVGEAAEQYLTVARAFYAHGVRAKARPYFERVLELEPAHAESLDSMLDCLQAENRGVDGVRFIRAALRDLLQAGRTGEARALSARLGPAGAGDPADPLRAALLLQSGEPLQAEAAAAAAAASAGPEAGELFKSLGRSALERGDGLAAGAYFRWSQGKFEAASGPSPAPVPGPPATGPGAPQALDAKDDAIPPADQAAWRTLGEVCLAEGMFEEARRIFGRLARSRPNYPVYAELLRRAEAGPAAAPPAPAPPALTFRAARPAPAGPVLPPWPGRPPSRPPAPAAPRLATLQPTAYTVSFGEVPMADIGPFDDSDELIE